MAKANTNNETQTEVTPEAAAAAIAAAKEKLAAGNGAGPQAGRAPTDEEKAEADKATKKKGSAKSKANLGIPEENVICWIPFDLPAADAELVEKAAKGAGDKHNYDVYIRALRKVWADDEFQAELKANADKAPESKSQDLSTKSPEQLAKAAEAAQKQLAKIQALLDQARAAQNKPAE